MTQRREIQGHHAWMSTTKIFNPMERIVVREDFKNKEIIGYTWDLTASTRNLKYFLEDASKHKARLHQVDFIGAFLQANVKNITNYIFDIGL